MGPETPDESAAIDSNVVPQNETEEDNSQSSGKMPIPKMRQAEARRPTLESYDNISRTSGQRFRTRMQTAEHRKQGWMQRPLG